MIPNNFERYISFSIDRLTFLASMQFIACSLYGLVKNLKETVMQHLRRAFPNTEQRTLLGRKGVYPYDHMDSMERFNETSLPLKAQFYNRLNEEHISDDDYAHA